MNIIYKNPLPKGTRIEFINSNDEYGYGEKATVIGISNKCKICIVLDSGEIDYITPGIDRFRVLTQEEVYEEKGVFI